MTAVASAVDWILSSLESSLLEPARKAAIQQEAVRIARGATSLTVDVPSKRHVSLCAAVLAAVEGLTRQLGNRPDALAAVGDALVRASEAGAAEYVEERLGVELDNPDVRAAFDAIKRNFIQRGELRFGEAFRYACEQNDEMQYTARIETCLFDAFFRQVDADDLTPLICRLDIVWADELVRRFPTLQFDRPTTLADGNDACRFRFTQDPMGRS